MNNRKNRSPEELAENLALRQERVVLYHDYIFQRCEKYFPNNPQDARDLTSKVVVSVLEDDDIDGEGVAPSLLDLMVKRAKIRWDEQEARQPSSIHHAETFDGARTEHIEAIETHIEHIVHMRNTWKLIEENLTPDQARAYSLKALGYSRAEIAETMDKTEAEVKALYAAGLYAARKTLASVSMAEHDLFRTNTRKKPTTAPAPAQEPTEAPEAEEAPTTPTAGTVAVERGPGLSWTIMAQLVDGTAYPTASTRPSVHRTGTWWRPATQKELHLLH